MKILKRKSSALHVSFKISFTKKNRLFTLYFKLFANFEVNFFFKKKKKLKVVYIFLVKNFFFYCFIIVLYANLIWNILFKFFTLMRKSKRKQFSFSRFLNTCKQYFNVTLRYGYSQIFG